MNSNLDHEIRNFMDGIICCMHVGMNVVNKMAGHTVGIIYNKFLKRNQSAPLFIARIKQMMDTQAMIQKCKIYLALIYRIYYIFFWIN